MTFTLTFLLHICRKLKSKNIRYQKNIILVLTNFYRNNRLILNFTLPASTHDNKGWPRWPTSPCNVGLDERGFRFTIGLELFKIVPNWVFQVYGEIFLNPHSVDVCHIVIVPKEIGEKHHH